MPLYLPRFKLFRFEAGLNAEDLVVFGSDAYENSRESSSFYRV